MNKKFFAALASATMAFTASGSIAVFADEFVEESNILDNGDVRPLPTKVVFSEANFGDLVNGNVEFKNAKDETVTFEKDKENFSSKFESVTKITLGSNFDGEIKGLEYFTGLKYFDGLSATAIKNKALDFSANTKLEYLYVFNAFELGNITLPKAEVIEEEEVYNLKRVGITKTTLTSLDLSAFDKLEQIVVTDNSNLKEIVLKKATKASPVTLDYELYLNNNALETINLDNYTVGALNLSGNHIGALDLSKATIKDKDRLVLGPQTFYVSEHVQNVNLKDAFSTLNLFKVSADETKYNKETSVLTLDKVGEDKKATVNVGTYTYDTGKGAMTVQINAANPMNRLYNPNSGEHFYTADLKEKEALVKLGWNDEGYGWVAPTGNYGNQWAATTSVYRLYNPNAGDHHYTMSVTERDTLKAYGWKDEGTGWHSYTAFGVTAKQTKGAVDVYRQYNPYANGAGSHNYTTDKAENDYLVSLGWTPEGIAWTALQ